MTRTPLDPQRTTGGRVSYSSIYALFRHMTVFENIAFGLPVRPKVARPTERDIQVRVLDLQVNWLARSLAVEPSVLSLDEPFGALHANVRRELRRTALAAESSTQTTPKGFLRAAQLSRTTDLVEATSARECRPGWLPLMVDNVLTCEGIGIPLTQSQLPADQSKTPALLFDPSNPAQVK